MQRKRWALKKKGFTFGNVGKVATSDTVTKLTIYKDLQDRNWLCHMENFATNNKVLFFSCPFSIQLLDKTEGKNKSYHYFSRQECYQVMIRGLHHLVERPHTGPSYSWFKHRHFSSIRLLTLATVLNPRWPFSEQKPKCGRIRSTVYSFPSRVGDFTDNLCQTSWHRPVCFHELLMLQIQHRHWLSGLTICRCSWHHTHSE